jgi:hypothetical protein
LPQPGHVIGDADMLRMYRDISFGKDGIKPCLSLIYANLVILGISTIYFVYLKFKIE